MKSEIFILFYGQTVFEVIDLSPLKNNLQCECVKFLNYLHRHFFYVLIMFLHLRDVMSVNNFSLYEIASPFGHFALF